MSKKIRDKPKSKKPLEIVVQGKKRGHRHKILGSLLGLGTLVLTTALLYSPAPRNIGYEFLDIEKEELNVSSKEYAVLDDIIEDVRAAIKKKDTYTKEEAIDIFSTINTVLKRRGFVYEEGNLLSLGLKSKITDCDIGSIIYASIGDALDLPINLVYSPRHVFVRWNLDTGDYVNWETTLGAYILEEEFLRHHSVSMPSETIGRNYMRNIPREELLGLVHKNLGLYFMGRDEYEKAIKHYQIALDLDPLDIENIVSLSNALVSVGDFEGCISMSKKAIDMNPNEWGAYTNMAIALVHQKKWQEAANYINLAIDLFEKFPHDINLNFEKDYRKLFFYRGCCNLELKSYDSAIEDFTKCAEQDKNNPHLYYNRGIARFRKGDYASAFEDYKIAAEGGIPEAYSQMAECKVRLFDWDGANLYLQKYQDLIK